MKNNFLNIEKRVIPFLGIILGTVLIGNVLVGCDYQKGTSRPSVSKTEMVGSESSDSERIKALEEEKAVIEQILQEMKDEAQADHEEAAKDRAEYESQLKDILQQLEDLKALKGEEPLPCGTEAPEPASTPAPAPATKPAPAPAPVTTPPSPPSGTPAGEPLEVVSVTPAQGDDGVSLSPTIQVEFNKPMDAGTVTSDTLYLFSKETSEKIKGTVERKSDTIYTLRVNNLLPLTTYIAFVTDVATTSGEPLAPVHYWFFTTGMDVSMPPLPTF